jgi:undecaprenol kinase
MKNQPLKLKLRNALAGIRYAWANEDNIRRHSVFAAATVLVFLVLQPTWIWWGLIVLCIGLIFASELLNSALEILIDHMHPDIHPAIGQVKDVLAGMVLVLSLAAVVIGVLAILDTI